VIKTSAPRKVRGRLEAQACENAFHEKAGRSQVSFSFFLLDKVFSRRVAAVAILPSALLPTPATDFHFADELGKVKVEGIGIGRG